MWQVPEHVRLELLAALATDPARPATMSYQEFLAWADEDTLAEWVDGSVVGIIVCQARPPSVPCYTSRIWGETQR
jgi:hypothetical protein